MRKQSNVTSAVMVFVRTKLPQYLPRTVVSLGRLTDCRELVVASIQGLRSLWRKGFGYQVGFMLLGHILVSGGRHVPPRNGES